MWSWTRRVWSCMAPSRLLQNPSPTISIIIHIPYFPYPFSPSITPIATICFTTSSMQTRSHSHAHGRLHFHSSIIRTHWTYHYTHHISFISTPYPPHQTHPSFLPSSIPTDRSWFCLLLDQNKIYNLIHYYITICTQSKSSFSTNYCSIVVF